MEAVVMISDEELAKISAQCRARLKTEEYPDCDEIVALYMSVEALADELIELRQWKRIHPAPFYREGSPITKADGKGMGL